MKQRHHGITDMERTDTITGSNQEIKRMTKMGTESTLEKLLQEKTN